MQRPTGRFNVVEGACSGLCVASRGGVDPGLPVEGQIQTDDCLSDKLGELARQLEEAREGLGALKSLYPVLKKDFDKHQEDLETRLRKCRSPLVNLAMGLAREAHGDTKDKKGGLFLTHPERAACYADDLISDDDPDKNLKLAIALMHDTIEDTRMTREFIGRELRERRFSSDDVNTILEALDLMTRQKEKGNTYQEYGGRLIGSGNIAAILAKICDLMDNSDRSRLPQGRAEQIRLMEKYLWIIGEIVASPAFIEAKEYYKTGLTVIQNAR